MKIKRAFESGSIRFGIFLVIATIGLLWKGGQSLYTAAMNRHPTTMSYEKYVETKPRAMWLVLTNCTTRLTESCFKSYYGSKNATELFIPVRGQESGKEKGKIHVLLATKNADQLAAFSEMQNLNSKEEALKWMIKNSKRVFSDRSVGGLVRFGVDLKDRDRSKLAGLIKDAADDFIILEEGAQPSFGEGIGFSVAGVMVLGGIVVYLRRNRETTTADV